MIKPFSLASLEVSFEDCHGWDRILLNSCNYYFSSSCLRRHCSWCFSLFEAERYFPTPVRCVGWVLVSTGFSAFFTKPLINVVTSFRGVWSTFAFLRVTEFIRLTLKQHSEVLHYLLIFLLDISKGWSMLPFDNLYYHHDPVSWPSLTHYNTVPVLFANFLTYKQQEY